MKSLIYGYGETGKSFERYLNKNNEDFEIFDSNISKYNNNLNLKNFNYLRHQNLKRLQVIIIKLMQR